MFFMATRNGLGYIFTVGENYGFAPSSRREPQSTGLWHLIVRVLIPAKTKPHPFGWGFILATRNGLEPATSSVTGWRANRLHHEARTEVIIAHVFRFVKTQN